MHTDKLGGKHLRKMIINLVLAEFNFRPQSEIQFESMVMSDWRAMASACNLMGLYNKMSSA